MSDTQFSDYIIYVDESGDHGLKSIDPMYPCFVLSFCIFQKEQYITQVVPSVQRLKFKWWGHDATILHTTDIKRETSDFVFLKHVPTKEAFMADLVSTPIGRKFLKPDQSNRAYDVIERKFRRSPTGTVEGWGYKVFP